MRNLVLITGSSGFIGRAAARRLADDFDVVGLDAKAPEQLGPLKEHVYADLTKGDSLQPALWHVRAVYGDRIASVIHLAAYADFSGDPSPLYEQLTVRGTERLLRELRNFQVEQLVFSSSMLVHAPCEKGQRIDEEWPLEPKWDYPQSKVDAERVLREQRGSVPIAVLRVAGVYDDRCHSIPIANQMQRIYERRLISHVFPGDTAHGQAFVHLDDLSAALDLLVGRRGSLAPELTLLIGEAHTPSYDELQRELGRLIHGEAWETRQIPKAVAKAGAWLQEQAPGEDPFIKPWMIDLADDHFELDTARANTLLGWHPQRSLRETLPKMVQALRQDPRAFYRENGLDTERLEHQLAREERPRTSGFAL